jgi:hypothetical protein
MENLTEDLNKFIERLETDSDYEMSKEMQESYFELKDAIEEERDHKLIQKFENLWKIYENPDHVIKDTLDDMYPETDGDFDIDDFRKD